jgi:(p)ppGpp synthase/HD superfamily hydrolase
MTQTIRGPRFEEALLLAVRLHADQKRKETEIPYHAHLLGVCALVLEDAGDEDQAIAALLHDSIEDQNMDPEELEKRFGERVRRIVVACTDAFEQPKPPWRERKEAYLRHLPDKAREILRVSAADKLHNARQILGDYRTVGEALWNRFNGKREGTLWYYRSLAEIFLDRMPGALSQELARTVAEIDRLALTCTSAGSLP